MASVNGLTYKITFLQDSMDCETCGDTYASGYVIECPDGSTIDKTPVAHCYSGIEYDTDQAAWDILEHAGIKVETETRDLNESE